MVFDQLAQERGAELGVESRIDDKAGVIELDAGAPCSHDRGRRQHLHETLRASPRRRMPDEFAFLPRDRVDGWEVCGAGQRHEGRHAEGGERHRFERMTLHNGDLGELNSGPRVIPLLHHLGHGGELRLVTPLSSGIEGERCRHIVESVGIERLDRADRLVAPIALRRRCRRAEGETSLTETLRGELSIIGNRYGGGSRVERLGRVGVADSLGGSPLPIGGASNGQGIFGCVGGERKALSGRRSIIKEAQGDPAGVEGRVDLSLGRVQAERSGRRLQTQVAAR